MKLHLRVSPAAYTIHRFASDAPLPDIVPGGFVSIVRTPHELSVICEGAIALQSEQRELNWRLIAFDGPFAFTETGVLAPVLQVLAEAGISILAISSFDTDYVLVKDHSLATAVRTLREAGHSVTTPGP